MSKKGVIIIPARYQSTRFPGKPLYPILGQSMLSRVYDVALKASKLVNDCQVYIATDDDRICEHAKTFNANVLMTDSDLKTGSDRVYQAATRLDFTPDYVINLQGDAPLTPAHFVEKLIYELENDDSIDTVTPVTRLTWVALDKLRQQKKETPFSGTTAVLNDKNQALWFSKNILPAIRKEKEMRLDSELSPVYRHIGLYGFKFKALEKFVTLKESVYEKLEGLEQLRLIENGFSIKACIVDYNDLPAMNGIDTLEDAKRCEILLQQGKLS